MHPIPGTGPFTITVGNNGSFRADQGVTYASNGNPLVCVASSPATGQYTVNNTTGIYTFSTGDAGVTVLITYSYTAISPLSTNSQNLAIGNPLVGPTSTFSATLFSTDPTTNAQFSVTLNQCVASKFSFDTNIEDFAKPDFEFQAFANAAGQVMSFNFGDACVSEEAFRHFAGRKDMVGTASPLPRNQGNSTSAVRRLSRRWRLVDVGRIRRPSQ